MEVKIKTNTQPQTNSNQTNPLNNTKVQTPQSQNINNPQINQLLQILQQLMQNNNINQTSQNNLSNLSGEFVIKSGMKASYIAARIENILSMKGQVVLSGIGYAVPALLDTILLTMKDFRKMGKQVQIVNFELFEKEFIENRKIVSGLRVTLKIQT